MTLLPSISLSTGDVVLSVIFTVAAGGVSFFVMLYVWDEDRKTESFDKDLRREIQGKPEFSGIQSAAEPRFLATSDSRFSKLKGWGRKKAGYIRQKPTRIVPTDGETLEKRKIGFIRERTRYIPGKNILPNELVAAVRNYFAYQMALSSEGIESPVVEHFRARLDACEDSKKVKDLGDPDHQDDITLHGEVSEEMDPLNDVFLKLVGAAERHCVDNSDPAPVQDDVIDECRSSLMLACYSLWTKHMQGIFIEREMENDECIGEYRVDIRDEDNWGYWILPESECDEDECKRIRYIGWKITDILNEYWRDDGYSTLYPKGDSIREMNIVEEPFLICLKDEDEFRGGASTGDG